MTQVYLSFLLYSSPVFKEGHFSVSLFEVATILKVKNQAELLCESFLVPYGNTIWIYILISKESLYNLSEAFSRSEIIWTIEMHVDSVGYVLHTPCPEI